MKPATIITIIILLLCLCMLPAAAVIQEVTVKGTVSAINQDKGTLTIGNPLQYGCSYSSGAAPVCSYNAMSDATLTGTVPSDSTYTLFKTGDTVVATSLGGAGGDWITIAKLYNALPAGEYVTTLVGDYGTIPTPLAGGYSLDMATVPDCTTCFGTTCTAASTSVNVLSNGERVLKETLEPRQVLLYNARNDGSSIEVTFVKGESSSSTCASGVGGMTGPQPVSVYIINVVPPVGFTGQEAAATASPTPVPTAAAHTTKSASLPFAATGAAGLVAALLAFRRK